MKYNHETAIEVSKPPVGSVYIGLDKTNFSVDMMVYYLNTTDTYYVVDTDWYLN